MDTLRQTGMLDKLTTGQQRQSVINLARDVTAFSDATGKSREEILKGMNAALREPSAAIRMATHPDAAQAEAFKTTSAFFAALPGEAGEQMPKFFSQLFGAGGNAFFTEMGKTFIQSGLGDLNSTMGGFVNSLQTGGASVEEMVHGTLGMRDAIVRDGDRLRILAKAGNQSAAEALSFAQSLLGLDEQTLNSKNQTRSS